MVFKKGQSYRKGVKVLEETRKKISLSQKGKHNSPNTEFTSERLKQMWKDPEYRKKLSLVNKGKPKSEETKKKISLAKIGNQIWKGKHHTEETKRKIGLIKKGTHPTKEAIEKNRLAHLGKPSWNKGLIGYNAGSTHYNWQGGKSFEPYGLEFNNKLKEQIRARDHYRCQQCFRHESELRTKTNKHTKLRIHHIDYNKQNNKPENLISLCNNCHVQTNYGREDWIKYFQERL